MSGKRLEGPAAHTATYVTVYTSVDLLEVLLKKKIVNKTSTIQNHLGRWDNFVSYSGLMESRRTECPGGRYLLDESLFWRFGMLC